MYASFGDGEPQLMAGNEQLLTFLQMTQAQDSTQRFIAIYADSEVPYGRLVEVLDMGARTGLKMVLATKPAPAKLQEASQNHGF